MNSAAFALFAKVRWNDGFGVLRRKEADMEDRQLLKLAAKAAGITLGWCEGIRGREEPYRTDDGTKDEWNPLTDDGDALRLAVKLHMYMDLRGLDPIVGATSLRSNLTTEARATERDATTRRAIVSAAAEIGKSKTPNVELSGLRGCLRSSA